jgi:hypothetical protein
MGPTCPRPSQGNFWDLPRTPNEKLPNLPSGSLFIVLLGNSVPIAVWKRGYVLFPTDRTGSSRVESTRVGSGRVGSECVPGRRRPPPFSDRPFRGSAPWLGKRWRRPTQTGSTRRGGHSNRERETEDSTAFASQGEGSFNRQRGVEKEEPKGSRWN